MAKSKNDSANIEIVASFRITEQRIKNIIKGMKLITLAIAVVLEILNVILQVSPTENRIDFPNFNINTNVNVHNYYNYGSINSLELIDVNDGKVEKDRSE